MKTMKVTGVASVIVGLSLISQAAMIQDFEGYADNAALQTDLVGAAQTANASGTLGATDGVSGSQALVFSATNNISPFFGAIRRYLIFRTGCHV